MGCRHNFLGAFAALREVRSHVIGQPPPLAGLQSMQRTTMDCVIGRVAGTFVKRVAAQPLTRTATRVEVDEREKCGDCKKAEPPRNPGIARTR